MSKHCGKLRKKLFDEDFILSEMELKKNFLLWIIDFTQTLEKVQLSDILLIMEKQNSRKDCRTKTW